MVGEKVTISTRTLQWKCVESRTYNKRLYYERFILAPLLKGQADTIGIAMRRALLAETEGTRITRAKFEQIPHEFSTIMGSQESVHQILMNLKAIVLRGNLYGTHTASICVKGPREVTAQDILLPIAVEIIDNTQHIASLKEPIDLYIELEIERNRGYRRHLPNAFQDGSYPIDAIFIPVITANHSVHSYGNGTSKHEILFLEIWTNGSLTPKEALHEASRNLIDFFIPFLHAEEENFPEEEKFPEELNQHRAATLPLLTFTFYESFPKLIQNKTERGFRSFFIDQCEFPPKIYNCLKKANIHTLWDLLSKSEEDLMKMEHFRIEDLRQIVDKYCPFFITNKTEIL